MEFTSERRLVVPVERKQAKVWRDPCQALPTPNDVGG